MNKLVSIITPCFNDAQYIEETVDSVFNQTYSNIEMVIADDGSTDTKTISILKELDKRESITVVYQENGGPSKARNTAVKNSKGEYILPLDADDTIDPTYIEKAVHILNTKPKIGAVNCGLRVFGEMNDLNKIPQEYSTERDIVLNNKAHVSCLTRREIWDKIGGWDESLVTGYEDWDFWVRLAGNGWDIYCLQEHLFNYRIKLKSRNRENNAEIEKHRHIIIQNNSEIFAKYWLELLEKREKEIVHWKNYGIARRINFAYKQNIYYPIKRIFKSKK